MFQTVELNLVPGGEMPVVNASQFDTNRVIRFALMNNGEAYRPRNLISAEFIIRKVDGTLVTQDDAVFASNFIDLMTTEQMTACAGKNIGELRLTFNDPDISEENVIISTLNFILEVERSPELGGINSESEIANLDSQIASIVDEQLDNYYTKTEIDNQIEEIVTEQVTPIVSGIVAEQVPPAVQAELDNYYTKDDVDTYFYNKTETDTLLSNKADTSDLPDMTNYYDKNETDTLLAGKVSNSTLNDYYNKTQVDNLIAGVSTDFTTSIITPASIQTFSDGGDNIPMKSCEVAIVAQQASGTPSPSSPLPITGFSSIDCTVCGKNLFDADGLLNATGWTKNADGSYTGSNYDIRYQVFNASLYNAHNYFNKSNFGENYTVSFNVTANSRLYFGFVIVNTSGTERYIDTGIISGTSVTLTTNCTNTERVSGIYFSVSTTVTITLSNFVINKGSSTTYEQYQGTTTPVSLGQTIYGGTADLVGGNGSKTHNGITIDGTEDDSLYGLPIGASVGFFDLPSNCVNFVGLCNKAVNAGSKAFAQYADGDCGFYNNRFYFYYGGTRTIADLKSYVANTIGGFQIVYKLATPTSFTFTGATIPTLSGVNNVYADSGDVNALEYFNNKADDIASMVRLMTRS